VKQDRALLAATLTRVVMVAASGDVDVIGVRFHPGRAYPFLSVAPGEVVDRVAPARDVVSRDLVTLPARLEPATTETLFTTVEDELLGCLTRAGSDLRFDRLASALVDAECPPIASLAFAAGISQRQFERLFKSRAGVSAKLLQRVVRFHRVAGRLLEDSSDLATLAIDTGFFDQAHMSHEFRMLAEVSPSRYPDRAGILDRLFAES
jgi:AraC-like DNA-binding protein